MKTNSKILNEIINENKTDALLLNEIIEGEMKSENPDFELIDNCADAVLEIKDEEVECEIPKFKYYGEKKNRYILGKTVFRIALVAAVILATTLTANAAVKGVTNKGIIENISIAVSKDKKVTTTAVETTTESTTDDTTKSTTVHINKKKQRKRKKHSKVKEYKPEKKTGEYSEEYGEEESESEESEETQQDLPEETHEEESEPSSENENNETQ